MKNNNSESHILQLDGLRFIAILMVLFAHWVQWRLPEGILREFSFSHGVILFFVLSGYLITGIILRNKIKYEEANRNKFIFIKMFYIRRFLRIFPVYYLTLFFLTIIDYDKARELFPWLVSYTSNIYQIINHTYIGNFNHFWSLAVEEQFYLFWPLLIMFTKTKYLIHTIITTIVISISFRIYAYTNTQNWMLGSYFILSCMNSLGIGALIAYLSIYNKKIIQK